MAQAESGQWWHEEYVDRMMRRRAEAQGDEVRAVAVRMAASRVAGPGHVEDVPISASEPTHDPKAGVRQ